MIDLDGTGGAGFTFPSPDGETLVLEFDFRNDVQTYFASRVGVPMAGKTLADAIAFDNANADAEMPFFGQDLLGTGGCGLRGPVGHQLLWYRLQ